MNKLHPLVTVTLLIGVAGCGSEPDSPTEPDSQPATAISINAGDQQQAAAGAAVAVPPSVPVRDADGQPVTGVVVTFSVTAGGGTVAGATPTTNSSGVAKVTSWILGPSGEQTLIAKLGSLPVVEFRASIVSGVEQIVISIGSAGGNFEINDPTNPYHGLTFTVPAGTVTAPTEWRLQVDSQTTGLPLPNDFRVAGPLLEISTNQARGSELVTLEVPVSANPGELTFLALYDPVRRVAELLPTVARTSTSVRVITTHFRGDLILGATRTGSGSSSGRPGGGSARHRPIAVAKLVPLILQPTSLSASVQLNRWPVLDHGSFAFPEGLGTGISALQVMASGTDYPWFGDFVKKLSIDGFYAEPGPLAVVQMAQANLNPTMAKIIPEMVTFFSILPKPERDALVLQDIVANMQLTGHPGLFGGMVDGISRIAVAASATSGSMNSLTFTSPAAETPTEITISAGGFGRITLPLIADGPAQEVSDLVPLSSFVMPFERIQGMVGQLGQLGRALSDSEREAINAQLAADAGLPRLPLEMMRFAGEPWNPAFLNEIVVRDKTAQLRLLGTPVTIHLPSGAEIGRFDGNPFSIVDDAGLGTAPPGTSVAQTFATFSTDLGSAMKQISVGVAKMILVPFQVTPTEIVMDGTDTEVQLQASVPHPPVGGFRIVWNWDDGMSSDNLGLTNASHDYATVDSYDIVVELFSVTNGLRLGLDTVRVRSQPSAWVGSVTSTSTSSDPRYAGTVYSNAVNLRFERAPGLTRYDLVSGQVIAWNDVPCAGYTSPMVYADLANQPDRPQWISLSEVDPNAPDGTEDGPSIWYLAQGSAGGMPILNKVCPSPTNPDPDEYVFANGVIWLSTFDPGAAAWTWTESADRDLLQGTYVVQSADVTQTWTWRLERVSEP